MAFNTKIDLSNAKVYQADGQQLTLSGNTVIATVGDLRYQTHPTFTGATQIVDKQYVDFKASGASGTTIYNLQTPATTTVGGITAGYVLTGKSSNCLLKEILTPYQSPAFSTFTNNVSTPVEVGTVISGSKSFSWTFTNGTNVCPLAFDIYDVTAPATIGTNCSSSSPQSATITTKTFTSCGDTQVWCGCAKNTCGTLFGSGSHTVTGLLPYFYGKCTCPGAAGAGRPTLTAPQVTGGTCVLAGASSSISIAFGSGANDYLWFAIPVAAVKTCWYVDAINNGSIGGGVSPAGNLFPTPVTLTPVQNVCWSGQAYCVYVSNKQTANVSMTIS